MINWLDENKKLNPIQEHIDVVFELRTDESEIPDFIVNDLRSNYFQKKYSSVLIFAHSRKKTEEVALAINERIDDYEFDTLGIASHYHAGLDAITRKERYEDYKSGKISILVATKAFGMGMDIRNIHFLYHLGPSSTFEDYLQEVGRAGRNEQDRKNAGFSKKNPIQAKCILVPNDFARLKDRLHRNKITWGKIKDIREKTFEYIEQFRSLEADQENAFPLPLDLLEIVSGFKDEHNKDTLFRIALYWLEKLQRIRLGAYTQTHLPFRLNREEENDFSSVNNYIDRELIDRLRNLLLNESKINSESDKCIMVSLEQLKNELNLKRNSEVFQIVFQAQRAKVCRLERIINLVPTNRSYDELDFWIKRNSEDLIVINATFDLASELLKLSQPRNEIIITGEELDNLIQNVQVNHFHPQSIYWLEDSSDKEEKAKKLIEEFREKRSKFAFKILNFIPKIRHKTHIYKMENGRIKIVQHIYNGYESRKKASSFISAFREDLLKLTHHVFIENNKAPNEAFNFVDLVNELRIEDKWDPIEYLNRLIFISKMLGYLKGEGQFLPLGIELFINDLAEINDLEENSRDQRIGKEFEDVNKIKEARSLALKCLSKLHISELHTSEDKDKFIKDYFQCSELQEFVILLEKYLDDEDLRHFREEALKEEVDRLNIDQRKVYDAPIDENIQVIAGPGTGKTHTLTLRVARLIHQEKINPENILILAYNRAVVIELKNRLKSLFTQLGYARIINQLKVFTFHGFMKYCLRDELKELDFHKWGSLFLKTIKESQGKIAQQLGSIKYIFVDEFQDITNERMDVLKYLIRPGETQICVIGDPNQSIYGYQRAEYGDPMDPAPYYEQFTELFSPIELSLGINYRSYSEILEESERFLSKNANRFDMGELKAFNDSPTTMNAICEIINTKEDGAKKWSEALIELLNDSDNIEDIALMFRSNNEVFRAFKTIQDLNLKNIRLRIQGARGDLSKTREFHLMLSELESKKEEHLEKDIFKKLLSIKEKQLEKYPNWEKYHFDIFLCIVLEYERERDENSTYADLIDFVKDLSSSDDGQYGKIYRENIHRIESAPKNKIEVILTTMHKVKGLEFDAVIIPPSFSPLPFRENEKVELIDSIEEERRLYYVAYTRAKKKLIIFQYDRESNMDQGIGYKLPEKTAKKIGVPVDEGIEKLTLYWNASYGSDSFDYIRDRIKIGDKITLEKEKRGDFKFWYVKSGDIRIGQLSRKLSQRLNSNHIIKDLAVSSVYVRTHKESVYSDEMNERQGSNRFSDRWDDSAKERGYIYLIDFSGYGKISDN